MKYGYHIYVDKISYKIIRQVEIQHIEAEMIE